MGIKKTNEEVKRYFKKNGYDMISEYTNSQTPVLVSKNGYKAYITYSNFRENKRPSFYGLNNIFFKENMSLFLHNKDCKIEVLDINIVSKGNRKRILLSLKCGCGKFYKKTWDTLYGKTYVQCNNCVKRKIGLHRRGSKQKIFDFIENKRYIIIDKSKDYLRSDWIEVINQDGYRGFVSYNKLSQGKNMSIFNIKINKKNFIYNINNYSKLHGYGIEAIRILDKGKWITQGIELRCSCGKIFQTSIGSFQNSKYRCENCSKKMSKWEHIVREYLDDCGIKYISEYRFNDCRDVLPLPFDFYLVDYKKIIEVDGEQHFNVVTFGSDQRVAVDNFKTTQLHDKIKNDYCIKKDIPLLRVSYNDVKNKIYSQKIKQFIGE
jgi:hypothetical group I intron protein|nr:MAG TPA: restriction enzyme [Caudoviricetes sp.]